MRPETGCVRSWLRSGQETAFPGPEKVPDATGSESTPQARSSVHRVDVPEPRGNVWSRCRICRRGLRRPRRWRVILPTHHGRPAGGWASWRPGYAYGQARGRSKTLPGGAPATTSAPLSRPGDKATRR